MYSKPFKKVIKFNRKINVNSPTDNIFLYCIIKLNSKLMIHLAFYQQKV